MQMISQYIYRLLRKMVVILSWHACLCRGGEQVEDVRDITWQQDLKNIQNWDSPIELSFTSPPPRYKILQVVVFCEEIPTGDPSPRSGSDRWARTPLMSDEVGIFLNLENSFRTEISKCFFLYSRMKKLKNQYFI